MRYFWFTLLSISILAIFAGCQRPEPQVPVLIAPEDGAVFDTTKPILIWNASNPEGRYLVVLIVTFGTHSDTSDLIEQSDTTHTLSIEGTECATIKWRVAVEADTGYLWSEIRTFYIDTRENVPALISPADGAVFDTFPPSFKWSTWPSCDYYLMIFKDSLWSKDTLFYDTFDYSYSSYTLPMTKLFSADTGTYAWTVGVKDTLIDEIIYPSPRIFKIKNTYFPVDLDTTYFPFDLGYEWCFKRHDWGYDEVYPWDWDYNYNFTISVSDTFTILDETYFVLSLGPPINIFSHNFFDLSIDTDVLTDTVTVDNWGRYIRTALGSVPIHPTANHSTVEYYGDTLYISRTKRLISIGAINQSLSNSGMTNSGLRWDYEIRDTLLWFFNGKDTVYKAP